MADLASSAVTVSTGWINMATPIKVTYKQLTLVLTGQGDATDTIDAATLGFTKLLGSTWAQESDDSRALPTCPSYAGAYLFFYNPANATDASRDDPYAATGTFRLTVWGV